MPIPYFLPPTKPWEWPDVSRFETFGDMEAFYTDSSKRLTLRDTTGKTLATKKLLRLTQKLPKNYYKFTEMVSTFAALLFELFGEFCGLHMDVPALYNVLTSELVKNNKHLFH